MYFYLLYQFVHFASHKRFLHIALIKSNDKRIFGQEVIQANISTLYNVCVVHWGGGIMSALGVLNAFGDITSALGGNHYCCGTSPMHCSL